MILFKIENQTQKKHKALTAKKQKKNPIKIAYGQFQFGIELQYIQLFATNFNSLPWNCTHV